MENSHLSKENIKVRDYVVDHAVIAHRGTTYWAPEETEAAYRWARQMGADYLEVDIQRSKDGVLLALHDNNLNRTTNCSEIFPEDSLFRAGNYTYEELMQLDAGSWFNQAFPERARTAYTPQAKVIRCHQKAYSFHGKSLAGELNPKQGIPYPSDTIFVGGKLYISTLEDVLMLAKGWRIARNKMGERLFQIVQENGKKTYLFFYVKDSLDNGNRPGVYIETKEPSLYPGVESDLYTTLSAFDWNTAEKNLKENPPFYVNHKVNTGNTKGKIVLQTFSPKSLKNLSLLFKGQIPTCYLLWLGDPNMLQADTATYLDNIRYAIENNAHFIGPSIGGEPNNYADLLEEWESELIHKSGLKIHGYSFDTEKQTLYYANRTDAMFTNRTGLSIAFFKSRGSKLELPKTDALQCLLDLGY
jgi:glycerophosphoryl diester phosphodiesterase